MTTRQKIEIKLSELRAKLSELAALEQPTADQITQLTETRTSYETAEAQLQAAIVAEPETRETETETLDAETRERLALLKKAKVGSFLRACIEGRTLSGAEAEVRAACGGGEEHEIPLAMFEPEPEQRAVTPAPAADTQQQQRPIQPFIYSRTAAAFLGIDMPSVEPGAPSYPVLTTATAAGMKAAGAVSAETAAAFTISTTTPKRATGSFRVRYEDLAVFPGMEEALRRDLPLSLANIVDQQILAGSGVAPNITGLLKSLDDPDAPANESTFQSYVADLSNQLDGIYSNEIEELALLVGLKTYAHMSAQFAADDSPTNAVAFLKSQLGGLRNAAADWISAPNGNVQQAVVRRGTRSMMAVCPLWSGIRLIRDEYSAAAKGEVSVTALQLLGDCVILHGSAFRQIAFKLAA